MPKLVVRGEGNTESTFVLSQPDLILGRDPKNPLPLIHRKVSRQHARIQYRDGAHWLEDLTSANGTYINGARIEHPQALALGNRIRIGPFELTVEACDADPALPVLWILRGQADPITDIVFELTQGVHSIGRVRGNTVAIRHASISRNHATLHVQGDKIWVYDHGSANGTWVNNAQTQGEHPIASGDALRFGNVPLLLHQAAHASQTRRSYAQWIPLALGSIVAIGMLAGLIALNAPLLTEPAIPKDLELKVPANSTLAAAYTSEIDLKLKKAQKAQQNQAPGDAMARYLRVLELDPLNTIARQGYLRGQIQTNRQTRLAEALQLQAQKKWAKAYASAQALLDDMRINPQQNDASDVLQEIKAQAIKNMAPVLARKAQTACRIQQWRSCHNLATSLLDIVDTHLLGQALIYQSENELNAQNKPIVLWRSKQGAAQDVRNALLKKHPEAIRRKAALRYATGDIDGVLANLTTTQGAARKSVASLLKNLRQIQRALKRATILKKAKKPSQSALGSAATLLKKALKSDAKILPKKTPNIAKKSIQENLVHIWRMLGQMHRRRGDPGKAQKFLEKAASLQSK